MKFKRAVQAMALAAATLLASAALAQRSAPNWLATVVETEGGHRIGNPEAKVSLTEFISYTCPSCARFAREGEAPLQVGYIATGRLNLEVRHLIRDPIDLTAAVLAHCGAPSKFPQNHAAFLLGQDRWIEPLGKATQAQQQRWRTAGAAGRRAIASDFGFYALMERRGYRRTEVDQCLADDALVLKLAEHSAEDWKRPGISGTPSFAINGTVVPGTHSWRALERQLAEFF
jgi:protein-disulfide isomerase